MATFNDRQLQYLMTTLQGTCDDLESTITEIFNGDLSIDDLTEDNHTTIDLEIFQCEDCSWWYEASDECSEIDDSRICTDCAEERNYHG